MRAGFLTLYLFVLAIALAANVQCRAQVPVAPPKKNCNCDSLKVLEPALKRDIASKAARFGKDSLEVATVKTELAALYARAQKYDKAEPMFAQAYATAVRLEKDNPRLLAQTLTKMGAMNAGRGNYQKAESDLTRALTLLNKASAGKTLAKAEAERELGDVYLNQSSYAKAEPLLKEALATKEKFLGTGSRDLRPELQSLSRLYMGEGNLAIAETYLKRNIAIARNTTYRRDNLGLTWDMEYLAWVYRRQGKYKLAEPLLRHVIAVREKALGADNPELARTLEHYAQVLRKTNKAREAALCEARAKALTARQPRKDPCNGCQS